MKVIDGKGMVLGRLASYVAKEALLGEEIRIVNCDQVIITGSYKANKEDFEAKRSRFGSSQKGPKHPATSEKIVKRAIKGMVPNHRTGRGRIAIKKVICYLGIPKEIKKEEIISLEKDKKIKYSEVREFLK